MRSARKLVPAAILLAQTLVMLCLLQAAGGTLHAQIIEGRVTDARTGLPLASTNILLQPGQRGTAAGQDGTFDFRNVEPGAYTLRASFVGYRTEEIPVQVTQGTVRVAIALVQAAMPGPAIEVSAIRARERETPATFSDIELKDLRERYTVQDVPVMLADLPSSTFYSESGNGMGYTYLRIRGFDQRRLAVMVNGIPQNDPEDHNVYWLDFVDLLGSADQIQVQRGAGSAFYGPPAIGGSINVVTGDFVNEKGIRLSSGYGSYNTRRSSLAVGSGLVDNTYTFFGRLSTVMSDGYREHSGMKANAYYLSATRYDANLSTRINLYGGPIEDKLAYTGLPKFAIGDREARRKNFNYWEQENGSYTYTQQRRPQEHERFSQPHAELLNEWKVSEAVTLNSALFYFTGEGYFDYDGTGYTDTSYYRMTSRYGFDGVGNPVNPIIRAQVDNRQFGWLPRATWEHGGGTLTAGLELRRHRSLHWGRIQWAEGLPEGYDPDRRYYEYSGGKDIASVYVQELHRLGDRLILMGNVMYVFNRYMLFDEAFVGNDIAVDYHFVNPRLGLNWNIDAAWNLYGNLSYTQREPRLKNLYDAAESSGGALPQFEVDAAGAYDWSRPLVTPEKLLNLEVGTGYRTAYAELLVNGYVMRFADEIIKSGQLDRFGQPVTGNAEATMHYGLELSGRWSPLTTLHLDVNGLVSRSRLTNYAVYEDDGSVTRLDGNRIAGFPELLANARVTWTWNGVTASLAAKFVGDQYTDNFQSEENKVDAYTVVNLMLGWRTPPVLGARALELRLAVNNLFDRLYAQSGEGDQFFVGAERNYFFDVTLEL
jgi:iron complex outermembrane recepter protein